MNAHPVILSYLDTNANVFIARKQDGICNRFEAGEFDQVSHDERINALLLSMTVYEAKSQLHIVQVCNKGLVGSRPKSTYRAIVPINTENPAVRRLRASERFQFGDSCRRVQQQFRPRLLATSDRHASLRKEIAGIYENGALIHAKAQK